MLIYVCTYNARLQASDLNAQFHCCYDDRVLNVSDATDKYRDFPAFLGGSGVKVTTLAVPSEDAENDAELVHTGSSGKA